MTKCHVKEVAHRKADSAFSSLKCFSFFVSIVFGWIFFSEVGGGQIRAKRTVHVGLVFNRN